VFYAENIFFPVMKQPTLMNRLTVLSLPLRLVFPGQFYSKDDRKNILRIFLISSMNTIVPVKIGVMSLSIKTPSIMTFSITTLSITIKNATLGIMAKHCYAECSL
jgi:hypothetical protein